MDCLMTGTNSQESAERLFDGHWTAAEFGAQRNKSERTLRLERQRGVGPPYVCDGRKIYYPIDTARAWLREQLRHPARTQASEHSMKGSRASFS
jgi:hypothetical protein